MSVKGVNAYNFGTRVGYSVLDMIHAFENVIRRPIPHKIVDQDQEMSKLVSLMHLTHTKNYI